MDRIGDLLTRIKNGYQAYKKEVMVPYSKLSLAILKLLQKEGFLEDCKISGREIKVVLKYKDKQPVLVGVRRISKPSRRIYKGSKDLPIVYNGLGMAIVSSPKGVMSDKEARKEGVGGEVMAYVW
jgi:small subunit ribosomal protein S8